MADRWRWAKKHSIKYAVDINSEKSYFDQELSSQPIGGAMRGGKREGAGRPRGAKNKRTREVEAAMKAVADEFAEAVPDAFSGDGVAFLQTVYKNPNLPLGVRIDAAARAARFERPMLASNNVRVIRSFEDLTDEELALLAEPPERQQKPGGTQH